MACPPSPVCYRTRTRHTTRALQYTYMHIPPSMPAAARRRSRTRPHRSTTHVNAALIPVHGVPSLCGLLAFHRNSCALRVHAPAHTAITHEPSTRPSHDMISTNDHAHRRLRRRPSAGTPPALRRPVPAGRQSTTCLLSSRYSTPV
ncbi:hypothetical protein HYPSUDRAFT_43210 [Hypholoma sublateritium FD-334 SS-4]|uniref:Uncharacterized protein n=1 Tax=Hypholoma sublateritium (strain FD-334 SS-4) TaxID=945553 RepID=A0A0D2L0X2_HYPSF|nr:hypothetical protein HYPSUDRAFT_43210 [Hypholoma sublateritium FD-334 SS-4]